MPVVSNISKLIICKEEIKEDLVYSCEFGTLDTTKSTKWTYSYTDTPDIRLPTNWDGETLANHYIVDLECEHQLVRFQEWSSIVARTLKETFVNILEVKYPYEYTKDFSYTNGPSYTLQAASLDGKENETPFQDAAWAEAISAILIGMYNIKPAPHKCFVVQGYNLFYHTGEQYMCADYKRYLELKESQPDMNYCIYDLQRAYSYYYGQYTAALLARMKCPNFLERGWDNLNVMEYVHLYLYKQHEDAIIKLNNMTDEEILTDINRIVKENNRPDDELYKELKPEMKRLYIEVSKEVLFKPSYQSLMYVVSKDDIEQTLFKKQVKLAWGVDEDFNKVIKAILKTDDKIFNVGIAQVQNVVSQFETFEHKLPENASRKEKEVWISKVFTYLSTLGPTGEAYIYQFGMIFGSDVINTPYFTIKIKLNSLNTIVQEYEYNQVIKDAWTKLVPKFNVDEIIKYLIQLKLGKDKIDMLSYFVNYQMFTTTEDFLRNYFNYLISSRISIEVEKLKTYEEKMNYLNEWETNLKNYKDNLVALANG